MHVVPLTGGFPSPNAAEQRGTRTLPPLVGAPTVEEVRDIGRPHEGKGGRRLGRVCVCVCVCGGGEATCRWGYMHAHDMGCPPLLGRCIRHMHAGGGDEELRCTLGWRAKRDGERTAIGRIMLVTLGRGLDREARA